MNSDIGLVSARPIRVMQFICPTGYYGAERWITALANNTDPSDVTQSLVVATEAGETELELCTHISGLGLAVHKLAMAYKFDVRAIFRLRDLLKAEKIDVLHTHGYKSDLIGVIAAKMAGVVSVCTPHGFENTSDIKLRTFIALGNMSFRFFDRVVPLSKSLCSDVEAAGVPNERITYIANGVDLKDIEERRKRVNPTRMSVLGKEGDKLVKIGYIGQMISRKNVGHIIDVFESLAAKHVNVRLVLIGDGDQRGDLERKAAASNYSQRIEFVGFVADAIPYYFELDAFIMTSSLEGIPRCLMEAMTADVPIVAYDIPGVDQLIVHDQTGFLVPFGDKAALSQFCEKILYEADTGSRLAASAHTYVEENHSALRMVKEYDHVYAELVASRV